MKSPFTPLSRELRAGMLALLVLLLLFGVVKLLVLPYLLATDDDVASVDEKTLQEIRTFERRRIADSARRETERQAQWDRWRDEKEQRRAAREERERIYRENRARWDAEKAERAARRAEREARYDSLRRTWPVKLKPGTHIDANAADTSAFRTIPGVGVALSRAIVSYRERLGGFVDKAQLREIPGLPVDIERWVSVAPHAAPRRIAVNRATFKQLVRHPYLNFEQVKAIMNRRSKTGDLRGWNDLRGNALFSDADFERLRPYFYF